MVTPAEVAHYKEFGWVMLRGFVTPDMVKTVIRTAIQRMG